MQSIKMYYPESEFNAPRLYKVWKSIHQAEKHRFPKLRRALKSETGYREQTYYMGYSFVLATKSEYDKYYNETYRGKWKHQSAIDFWAFGREYSNKHAYHYYKIATGGK